jgi:hypothetical protein
VFPTREAADQAKRRLDQGERFEVIAFEQNTSGDGGDLGFSAVDDLTTAMKQEVNATTVGNLIGPLEAEGRWYIYQVLDRRTRGVPSLETLRPRIIDWLRYQEITQLDERLARDARVERLRQPEEGVEPGGEVTAPADAEPTPVRPTTPAPDANAPPFPFPMGAAGSAPNTAAQTPAQRPAPQPQRPPASVQQPPAQPAQQEEETSGTQ